MRRHETIGRWYRRYLRMAGGSETICPSFLFLSFPPLDVCYVVGPALRTNTKVQWTCTYGVAHPYLGVDVRSHCRGVRWNFYEKNLSAHLPGRFATRPDTSRLRVFQ